MTRQELDKHLRTVLKKAQESYRVALASQVRGEDDAEAWADFREACSALLLASWLFGAAGSVQKAKIPSEVVEKAVAEAEGPEQFDRDVPGLRIEAGSKYLAPLASWFRRRIPVSRGTWETLIQAASLSAGDVTEHEKAHALADLRRKSPILDGLLRGIVSRPGTAGITTVKRITDGTFFVTGMNQEQTRLAQELVAQVIEQKPGRSTVGKLITKMNLGDFVTTTQAVTGTALTTARLETVLRTNTNRAATEGAAEVLREPAVQAFVPLVQYSATKDPRTREEHRAMDGYVGTIEDFDRMGISPPCGFNCRCALLPVPAAMAMDKGWTRPDGTVNAAAVRRHNGTRQKLIEAGRFPDPGFVNA